MKLKKGDNVAMLLLRRSFPDSPPFRIIELAMVPEAVKVEQHAELRA